MNKKIILSVLLDHFVAILLANLLMFPYYGDFYNLFTVEIKNNPELANDFFYYLLSLLLVYYGSYIIMNLIYRLLITIWTKGKSIGKFLQGIEISDDEGFNPSFSQLFKSEVLCQGILNPLTLGIFNLIDFIKLVGKKNTLTYQISGIKYKLMEDFEDGTF